MGKNRQSRFAEKGSWTEIGADYVNPHHSAPDPLTSRLSRVSIPPDPGQAWFQVQLWDVNNRAGSGSFSRDADIDLFVS